MTGKWSQLQRCDRLRRSFTHSAKHVLDSSCHDCMDGADCMTKKARGLCLDCMDGADCRKAPGCPGELDGGAHLASKLYSSTTEQTSYTHRRAQPNCRATAGLHGEQTDCLDNKQMETNRLLGKQTNRRQWLHRKLFACPKSPCDPQRIRPKRQWLHRKLLASPSDGTLLSYLPPQKNKLAQTFPG